MMSQNKVYTSKTMCLGDWYRGACLGLYLDRFNHSEEKVKANDVAAVFNAIEALISHVVRCDIAMVGNMMAISKCPGVLMLTVPGCRVRSCGECCPTTTRR